MKQNLALIGVLAIGAVAVSGCEDGVRVSLKERIETRANEGMAEFDEMLKKRDEAIRAGLEEKVAFITTVQQKKKELTAKLDRVPSEQEIASEAGLSAEKVREFGGGDAKEHPLVPWRKSLVKPEVKSQAEARQTKYPGTFLEGLLPAYVSFLDTQDQYWTDSMGMEDYAPFLEGYAKDAMQVDCGEGRSCSHSRRCIEGKCEASPFVDDALFDWVFLHMQHLADARRLPEDTRMTSHLRYWQLALGLESQSREGFKNYIHRLCEMYLLEKGVQAAVTELKNEDPAQIVEHMKTKSGMTVSTDAVTAALLLNTDCGDKPAPPFECLSLADEFRAQAVMQPYYDQLLCRMEALEKQAPESPYLTAVKAMKAEIADLKMEYPIEKMVAYPALPETTSVYDASQRLVLEVGPKGAFLGDRRNPFKDYTGTALVELGEGEEFGLTGKTVKAVRDAFLTNLTTIRAEGEPALRQGLIALHAEGSYDARLVMDLATSATNLDEEQYGNTLNQEIWLAGRRKVDGRNTKRATQLQLLKGDKRMKMSLGTPSGKLSCTVVGFTGDAPVDELPEPVAAAVLTSDSLTVGALIEGKKMEAADAEVKNDELVPAAVSGWADQQRGAVVLAVKSGPTYNQMMRALGPLSFKCTDPACRVGEYRTKPNVYVAACN